MATKLILSDLQAARVSMGLDAETAVPVVLQTPEPDEEDTDTEEEIKPTAAVEPVVATLQSSYEDGLSAYLKDEVTALKAENATLKGELAAAAQTANQLQAALSTVNHLRPVAEAAVQRLSIGLGHRPSKLEHMPADLLAETFNDLQAELLAMPAGRQTAEPSVDNIDGQTPPDTLAQHRLRLVPAR